MGTEPADKPERLTAWVIMGASAVAAALVVAAIALSWPTQAVANALQLLGIGLTALGVAVVRSWLALATDKAHDAKQGLERWWAMTEERLRTWRAHRRGRGVHLERSASDMVTMTDSASVRKQHYTPVPAETGSDREWLIHLDQQLHALYDIVDEAQLQRHAELSRRLAEQRDALRGEIQRETRQGWELIVAGLAWSAVGTAIGIFG